VTKLNLPFSASVRSVACALWLLALSACASRAAPASVIGKAETHAGPLAQLVPPGPSLMLFARPRELAESPALRSLWRAVVLEEREQAFVARTGVVPLEVTELVVCEVPPSGYVVLARGPFDADDVVKRAGHRIAVLDVTADEPLVRREGLRGDGRYAYASLDSHAVLAAKDAPPELIGSILARLRDPKSPRTLDAPEASALEREHGSAPLLVLELDPLKFQPGTPVAMLFARQRALAVSVRPVVARTPEGEQRPGSTLAIAVDLRGEFPPGAEQNFRTLVRSMAQAPLGSALGLTSIAEQMGVRADEQGVLLTASLETAVLEATLKLMLAKEMREMLE
jgi:hypothetical protein